MPLTREQDTQHHFLSFAIEDVSDFMSLVFDARDQTAFIMSSEWRDRARRGTLRALNNSLALSRSTPVPVRQTGVFGHQSERNLSPRHGAGRASVPRGGRGSRGSRWNRVWASRGRGEAERVSTPCARFPEGSRSTRLESRGSKFPNEGSNFSDFPVSVTVCRNHKIRYKIRYKICNKYRLSIPRHIWISPTRPAPCIASLGGAAATA